MLEDAFVVRIDLFEEQVDGGDVDFGDSTSEGGPADTGTQTQEPATETGASSADATSQEGASTEGTGTQGPQEGTQEGQKIFGRFDSLDQAEKSYKEMQTAYQQANERLKQFEQPQQPQQQAPQDGEPRIDTPWGQLTEGERLQKYWENPVAYEDQMAQHRMQPQIKAQNFNQVSAALQSELQDFGDVYPHMQKFVQENPEYAQALDQAALDPQALSRQAKLIYWAAKGRLGTEAAASTQQATQQVAQQRAQAQAAGTATAGSGARQAPQPKETDWTLEEFGEPPPR